MIPTAHDDLDKLPALGEQLRGLRVDQLAVLAERGRRRDVHTAEHAPTQVLLLAAERFQKLPLFSQTCSDVFTSFRML